MSNAATAETNDFLCGVVEGFYSKPWSPNQRLDLYDKLKNFGLNTYLYAPKDDAKHRALWRELYTTKELDALKQLMNKCQENNVIFIYGISPGLDISYSQAKELDHLKEKLDQLKKVGCKGFALLWDDIDTTLPLEDREAFDSLADAHVAITNKVFAYLGRPTFLLCPVEYCSNRADPNVKKSDYLKTLGRNLEDEIKIFWTGSKVVSEIITCEELKELTDVLQRKPVIWDNLHANDYDQQRLFLGPFSGRSTNLIPFLSGVLTNPNCEYSFNIPVLYTLGSWYRSYSDNCGGWEPYQASKEAIPHFVKEMNRTTSVSATGESHDNDKTKKDDEDDDNNEHQFKESEVELLFHLYWLPHSHGPKAQLILDEFDFLKRHANLMQNMPSTLRQVDRGADEDEEDSSSSSLEDAASQSAFLVQWMRRFSVFNDSCKKICKMLDKFTYIKNRELFFDINPYLNNLQVILRASNRYLKWVSFEKCAKPINGGPTLAGLIGGFVGDLQRLYPVQSTNMFPLRKSVTYKDCLVVRPLLSKERSRIKHFLQNMSDSVEQMICPTNSMTQIFSTTIADQTDSQGYLIEDGNSGGVLAFLIASKHVSSILKTVKKNIQSQNPEMTKVEKFDALNKSAFLAAFSSIKTLFFTKALKNMFEAFFEANVKDINGFALIIDKFEDLVLNFLSELNMRKSHEGTSYIVVKKN